MPDFVKPDLVWPRSGGAMRIGFRLPRLRLNVGSQAGGPVDFSDPGLTVVFNSYNLETGVIDVNAASATGGNGYLEYAWATADTDSAGDFRGYFRVTDSSGRAEDHPRDYGIIYKIRAAG